MIYVRSAGAKSYDERTVWYRKHLNLIKLLLKFALALVATFIIYLLIENINAFYVFKSYQWLMIFVFPLVAALYTFRFPLLYSKKIRQIGWLKPFVVGFTWSGWVTVYPVLVWQVQSGVSFQNPVIPSVFFWSQNFLFISILAIIFDIKDRRTDVRLRLNTYPAKLGISNTFRYVIYPVFILNLGAFLLFQRQKTFSPVQIFIQLLPYLFLLWVILKHRKPRRVLYYLVVVDGLMFLKAICGIISISFL
jgi:4-hydroxybenzoate polyprenyltransferase